MADRDENRLINEAGVKAPANIKYHAGFVSGLELLLWKYREQVVKHRGDPDGCADSEKRSFSGTGF